MDRNGTAGQVRAGTRVPAQYRAGSQSRQQGGAQTMTAQRTPYVRTTAQRAWMLVGVLIIEAISWGIAISGFLPASASQASGADYWSLVAEATGFAALCLWGVHLVAFAFLAPLASYRSYDTFFLLVPLVSVVFWFRIVWRLTALPERYWPPRDDEVPAPPRRPADPEV